VSAVATQQTTQCKAAIGDWRLAIGDWQSKGLLAGLVTMRMYWHIFFVKKFNYANRKSY
jgi:hypothetical protein